MKRHAVSARSAPARASDSLVAAHDLRARRQLNGAFFLVFAGGGAFQQFVGPYLLATYHLSIGTGGDVLATIYLAAFVCLTFTTYSLAVLGDRLALVLGTAAYGVFGIVAVLTGNVATLVCAAAVWGWGASVLWTAGAAMTLDAAGSGRYGRAAGLLYTYVFVGQALGVLLLGTLDGIAGARAMAVCAAGVTLLGTLIALGLPRRCPRPQARPRLLNPLAVFATPRTRLAALILLLSSSGYGLLLGVFGHIVGALYGLPAVGWITTSFYVARIPAGSGGGRLIDHLGRRRVLRAAFLASAIALLLAVLLRRPAIFAACAAMLGVQAAIVPVGLTSWVGDRVAVGDRPSTYAAIQLWSNVGTGLAILGGSTLLSVLGGWQESFVLFAAIFLVCTALASRLT